MTQAQMNSVKSVNSIPGRGRGMLESPASSGQLTARGRRVLAAFALLPVVLGSIVVGTRSASATATAPATRQVVVHQGESLWDIAVAVKPGEDPRKTIWKIQQLNHMATSEVIAGQGLLVPNE